MAGVFPGRGAAETLSTFIDGLHNWLRSDRSSPLWYRLTLLTRILLAAGFIPTGMVKLLGQRFTVISPDHPIGAFFEALFQTGLYWQFLGATQVVGGVLLLIPATAHVGAMVFFGVILNIVVITLSLDFGGTVVITTSMLGAVGYLWIWDWHRFRSIFCAGPADMPTDVPPLDRWESIGFVTLAASLLSFFGVTRGFGGERLAIAAVLVGLSSGIFTLVRFLLIRPSRSSTSPRSPLRR